MSSIKEKPCGAYSQSPFLLLAVLLVFSFTPPVFAALLAKVDETPIHDREVKARVRSYLKQIGHERLSPVRMASLKKEVLKKLIEEELLYQEALKADLIVTEEEIALGVQNIRQRFPSQKDYLAALDGESLSLDDIRKGVSRSILVEKIWQRLSKMDDMERAKRLGEMTKKADIQIFEAHIPAGSEAE